MADIGVVVSVVVVVGLIAIASYVSSRWLLVLEGLLSWPVLIVVMVSGGCRVSSIVCMYVGTWV